MNSSSLQWKQRFGIVPYVIGIIEFVRFNVFVADTELAREGFGVLLMRFGDGSGIGCDGDSVVAEGLFCGPREVGGISAAGIGYDDPPHFVQEIVNVSCLEAAAIPQSYRNDRRSSTAFTLRE